MKSSIAFSIILLVLLPISTGCAMTREFGPYSGRVIDGETKEPIEGAAVLAVFYTEEYGPAGAISHYADALETVTDKKGEFKLPAKRVTTTFSLSRGFDKYGHFTIFKPGYGCYPNHKDVKPMFVPNGTLPANQFVTIELPRLRTMQERLTNIMIPLSSDIPIEKYKALSDLINQEMKNLGRNSNK
jgi:hypothetical protein